MDPVSANWKSNRCGEVMSSSCVSATDISVPSCIQGLCGDFTLTDYENAQGALLCNLITQLNQLTTIEQTLINSIPPVVDFSQLNLGCLYQPVLNTWTCPCTNNVFVPDKTTSVGGAPGYCGILGPSGTGTYVPGVGWVAAATSCVPILSSIPNTTPPPNTLLGVLQLIINSIQPLCTCDPCSGPNKTGP